MAEKRKTKRKRKWIPVTFLYENKVHKSISSNFSETGLFIKTESKFMPGSPVCMVLELDDDLKTAFKGKVVRITTRSKLFDTYRSSRNGIGVELTKITQEYKEFYNNF